MNTLLQIATEIIGIPIICITFTAKYSAISYYKLWSLFGNTFQYEVEISMNKIKAYVMKKIKSRENLGEK